MCLLNVSIFVFTSGITTPVCHRPFTQSEFRNNECDGVARYLSDEGRGMYNPFFESLQK